MKSSLANHEIAEEKNKEDKGRAGEDGAKKVKKGEK